MEKSDLNEEDEDVVIHGGALYEHLSKCGYTDFESVSMPKRIEEKRVFNIDIRKIVKNIYAKLFTLYSWMTQEKSVSKNQLSNILNAETILHDHSSTINDFLIKCNNEHKTLTPQDCIAIGAILVPLTCIVVCKCKIYSALFTASVICCTGYIKYLRFYADRDLRNLISLQNELFAMCKKGLNTLRYDLKIKLDPEKDVRQSLPLLGEKLQSLTETILAFMENISNVYYQCSLLIAKLIPPNVLNDESFTKFEHNSFCVSEEIDYQVLKKLYHTYLLVQSEMLYLLAIAYDSDTWLRSCRKIPETELARIIRMPTKILTAHKEKLSEILNDYDACKAKPIRYRVRNIAKWANPAIHLDLASYKLQLAYNEVFLIFKNIDDRIAEETGIDGETADALLKKLYGAFKEFDVAKNLTEFVILLLAKSGFNNLRSDLPAINNTTIDRDPDLPVKIIDSDPEILDEVFEEYIKEDLKPFYEEEDEYSWKQYKLDKLLQKNFISELKEALVEKQKLMSERESKALQRQGKNISKDLTLNTENEDVNEIIPVPPSMPPRYLWSSSADDVKSNSDYKAMGSSNCEIKSDSSSIPETIGEINKECDSIERPRCQNVFNVSSAEVSRDKDEGYLSSLPQILVETQAMQFVTKPSPFLQEETFVGSGENSEDEITSEDNETSASANASN